MSDPRKQIIKLSAEEKIKLAKQIDYIRRREKAHIKRIKKDDKNYLKKLRRIYKSSAKDLEKSILASYMRYAGKEGLTINDAYKKASRMDVQAFADQAAEYVRNKDLSPEANEQLRAYNLKMRVSRMELMKREIEVETMLLQQEETKALESKLRKDQEKELERQAGILGLNKKTRQHVIKQADKIVEGSFQDAPFSKRVWANMGQLTGRLQTGLERTILRGRHPREFARDIAYLVRDEYGFTHGGALFAAERLAITETARVQEETALESFKAGGFDKYIWIAEQDGTVCEICSALDGMVFSTERGAVGISTPPIHPFCRCSVAAFIE